LKRIYQLSFVICYFCDFATLRFVFFMQLQQFPLWMKMARNGAPLAFDLEITARCMNNCRHCYINVPAGDRPAQRNELTFDEINRFADEAVGLGALWYLITGGEPLLRPDFAEIYLALKRKGLLVSVFTTAQILTEEHVSLFRHYPPRDIEITVYGVTRRTYERITRSPGSFAAFMRGLDRLLGAGIKVRLKAMAMQSNAAELAAIARFCREKTKDFFRLDPLLHQRFDRNAARNAEIRAERLSPLQVALIELSDEKRAELARKECNPAAAGDPSRASDLLFSCGAGIGQFSISYDARFRLCQSLCHPACTYDLRKGSLHEAWKEFVPAVRTMKAGASDFLEKCRSCRISGLCSWCPAYAHLENGDLASEVKYFCDIAHARAHALRKA
jgi:radical SAM protein with 4Fe4S-binding SPASM domain